MNRLFTLLIIPMTISVMAQGVADVYKDYDEFSASTLNQRRFKHADIVPLIAELDTHPDFEVKEEGESIQGRAIYSVKWGKGPTSVLLWSQMHGDEATATMAMFDVFNFLKTKGKHEALKKHLSQKVTLYFIPMLNPDGAEVFQRRNALGVDLNRDALRLQSPEARILKNKRDETQAVFGFNLHDQNRGHGAGRSGKPATISFLAPAYNYEKDFNEVRERAVRLIALLNKTLQVHIPGQVGKYSDDFEPRAFGDNIQKWGTSLVLIESGGNIDDREKQEVRKVNFLALLTGFAAIADNSYTGENMQDYDDIPFNEQVFFDLLVENVTVNQDGQDYLIDLGINQHEIDYDGHKKYFLQGQIEEVGDLSVYYGYDNFDGDGHMATPGLVWPDTLTMEGLKKLDFEALHRKGYLHVMVKDLPLDYINIFPVNILSTAPPLLNFKIGDAASFVMQKDEKIAYVVLNGFLFSPGRHDKAYGAVH